MKEKCKGNFLGDLFPDFQTEIVMLILFFVPLLFLPTLFTTFELPKVVFFRSAVIILIVVTIGRWFWQNILDGARQQTHRESRTWWRRIKDRIDHGRPLLHKNLLWISGVIFLSMYGAATLFSVAPAISLAGIYGRFQGTYTFVCYVFFGMVVFWILRRTEQKQQNSREVSEKLLRIMMAAAICAATFAVLSKFLPAVGIRFLDFWNTEPFLGRVFGTMGHPDFLAGFLIMVMPVMVAQLVKRSQTCVHLASTAKDPEKKRHRFALVMMVASLAMCFLALYFTASRAAFLGLFAGLTVFAFGYGRKNRKKIVQGMVVLVVIFTIMAALMGQRFLFQGENMRSIQSRISLWQGTIAMIASRPFFGYGPDTFALAFPKFAPVNLNFTERLNDIPDRAHNEFLDMAASIGLPGTLAYTFFLGSLIMMVFKRIVSAQKNLKNLHILGVLSGLVALFVNNQLSFSTTVHWVYMATFVAILLNFLMSTEKFPQFSQETFRDQLPTPHISQRYGFPRTIIAMGVLAVLSWVWWYIDVREIQADAWYRAGYDARNKNEVAVDAFQEAVFAAPWQSFYRMEYVETLMVNKKFDEALQQAKIATELRHEDSYSLVIRAEAEAGVASAGADTGMKVKVEAAEITHFDQALADFGKASTLAPFYPRLYLSWGKTLLDAHQEEKAGKIFEYYLSIVPDFYCWKDHLDEHTPEEREQYRIFYKLNPDFDRVFEYWEESMKRTGKLS